MKKHVHFITMILAFVFVSPLGFAEGTAKNPSTAEVIKKDSKKKIKPLTASQAREMDNRIQTSNPPSETMPEKTEVK